MDSDQTTPFEVAAELGIDVGSPRLPRLIRAASAAVLRYLNRARLHYGAAIVDTIAIPARQVRLLLDTTPIASVASVVLDGAALTSGDWTLEDPDLGILYRSAGWTYTGAVRPGLQYADPDVGSEQKRLIVTYAGGWVTPAQNLATPSLARTLPYDLEQAVIATVVSLYHSGATDARIAAESMGSYSATYRDGAGVIPDAAVQILDRWRRVVP